MAKVARLLEQIIPQKYHLDLDVNMRAFTFETKEAIDFELKEPSRSLTFHAQGLDISQAALETGAKAEVAVDAEAQTVTFEFEDEVPAGNHTLSLVVAGSIHEELHGFYRSNYERDGKEQWLVTTQFEATHAREAFVCIDEPSAKAVFELSLTVPDTLTVISNTNDTGEEPARSGHKRVRFAPTPKMSTYLVAFLIGEFEHVEAQTPEGVTVRAYATPGQTGQLAFALDTAVRTLSFFNEYFGIPYPLPKLDMIAVPDFAAGAMENWGAVTYRETALLLDPAKTSLSHKQRVGEVVAHELAHQWFGNLVTMSWWDDLWLNEGFASWIEVLAQDHLFPEWNLWTEFASSNVSYAMELDGLANTHPIQVEVDDPRHLDEIFDAISYSKGASIINMLHHYLGAEAFQKGLNIYLERHKYGNTVTHDLWKALGEASGKPVDEVMSAWTSQPGYPLVALEDGEARQGRFYSSPREAAKAKLGAAADSAWPIPYSVLLAGGRETEPALIKEAALELPEEVMASDWFKPNPGQTGFYRTLYTEGMIGALNEPLRKGKLSPVDRFGVMDDVMATTEAGVTDSTVLLKLVAAMREETDYVVWGGVAAGLGSLQAVVEDEPLRDQLDAFGGWLVQPNVERLGWEPKANEPVFDTLMRPLVLQQAIRYDNPKVTKEAKRRFTAYLEGAPVDPELRPVVLYAAARHGGTEEFEAILERYRRETSPQVKMSLLAALGRFRKPALIKRHLELGISDDVRAQDIFMVLAWSFRNRHARDTAWAWVKDHWDLWIKRYGAGGHMLERFPTYAGMGFATHAMAAEIKEFFESHPHPATKRPTAQAVEGVGLKADWYDRDKLKIQTFIDEWKANQK
ncbi:MAG: hypothetical protein JWN01_710 [Patescibacteria group bacterium]|nr:hypothetical protein [Patescibacteria group bacterium]